MMMMDDGTGFYYRFFVAAVGRTTPRPLFSIASFEMRELLHVPFIARLKHPKFIHSSFPHINSIGMAAINLRCRIIRI
jgi:hypothetical protein